MAIEFAEFYETTAAKQLELVDKPAQEDPDEMKIIPHEEPLGKLDITFEAAKDVAKALALHVKDDRRLVVKVPNKETGELDWKFSTPGKKSAVPGAAHGEAANPTPVATGLAVVKHAKKRIGRED